MLIIVDRRGGEVTSTNRTLFSKQDLCFLYYRKVVWAQDLLLSSSCLIWWCSLRLSSEISRVTANVFDNPSSLISGMGSSRLTWSVLHSVSREWVETSSEMTLCDGLSVVRWQEKIFSSWLRTGRTCFTALVENNERRIVSVTGDGEMIEGFVDVLESTARGDWAVGCFLAIRVSRSETRAVVGCCPITVVGVLMGLAVVFAEPMRDLFTNVWAGRGRFTVPVTGRRGSGDFESV